MTYDWEKYWFLVGNIDLTGKNDSPLTLENEWLVTGKIPIWHEKIIDV